MNQSQQRGNSQDELAAYPRILLNHLMQPRSHPSLLSNQRTTNDLLAAAIQQQLVASLASPSPVSLLPLASQSLFRNELSNTSRIYSGTEQEAMIRQLAGTQGRAGFENSRQRAEAETKKEAVPAKQSVTQIPCQARGMSTDHNSLTAYFLIPDSASHGQHLFCSHPSCRAAGVKFRYCFFCKKPVTKQNFRSRHLHADLDKANETTRSKGKKESKLTGCAGNTVDNPSLPSKKAAQSKSTQPVTTEARSKPSKIDASVVAVKRKTPDCSSAQPSNSDTTAALNEITRRRCWVSLLSARPHDPNEIHTWVADVMSVSDRTVPCTISLSILSRGKISFQSSVQQQSRWSALLDERPSKEMGSSQMTAWMVKVIEVSCPEYDSKVETTKPPLPSFLATRNIVDEPSSRSTIDNQAILSSIDALLGKSNSGKKRRVAP